MKYETWARITFLGPGSRAQAARLRCAAKLGGPDMKFGGYIVPRGPTGGVAHGTVALLKKAVACE